jgi:nicotinamide mononucleotide transporter
VPAYLYPVNLPEIYQQFIAGIISTGPVEFIAVITGIASVWFSRKENILLYPVGLINTVIYIYLSLEGHLFGEASVNFYYTVMSIYGWILWAKKDKADHHPILHITTSNKRERLQQIAFFCFFYLAVFLALSFLKKNFAPGALPAADAFASATAFTGMWLMAKKKAESWYWWIATNLASIPLYFVKGYVFTSFYYLILLIMSVAGLITWVKKSQLQKVSINK